MNLHERGQESQGRSFQEELALRDAKIAKLEETVKVSAEREVDGDEGRTTGQKRKKTKVTVPVEVQVRYGFYLVYLSAPDFVRNIETCAYQGGPLSCSGSRQENAPIPTATS